MQFADNSFSLVVFDPPHLTKAAPTGWQATKYGILIDWRNTIRQGFSECFRVLRTGGFLIFKWNEIDIKLSEILKLTDQKPILGHRCGKQNKTHWILFQKNIT